MSIQYTIKITPQAESQMQEIAHYIAYELKNPDSAINLLSTFENTIMKLENFPERVPLTDKEPWRSKGIRHFSVKNFLIYFWIDKENLNVHVTAVIYEKREQLSQLSSMNLE